MLCSGADGVGGAWWLVPEPRVGLAHPKIV